MNSPIWHIIFKDHRRFRALLALWCVALVTRVVAVGFIEGGSEDRVGPGLMLMSILVPCLNALLVTRVLAEDSPLKEAAFWRSRPITGRQMMLAKVIFLAGWTLVLPTLTILVAGYGYGFTVKECLAVATGQLMIHALVGGLFLTTSLFTQRVWAAVLGMLVLLVAVQLMRGGRVTPEQAPDFESTSRTLSGVSVSIAIGLVAVGCAMARVYRERHRVVAAAVLIAGAAGVYLANDFWRVDFLGWVPALERLEARVDPQYKGSVRPIASSASSSYNGVNYRELQATVEWEGLKPDQLSFPYRIEGRLEWRDGPALKQNRKLERASPYVLEPALSALGLKNLTPFGSEKPTPVTLVELTEDELLRLKKTSSPWTGRVFAAVGRMDVHARLPLKSGARTTSDGYRIEVINVDLRSDRLQVSIIERQPALSKWGDGVTGSDYSTWLGYNYALINPRRKEALLSFSGNSHRTMQDGFVKFNRAHLNFSVSTHEPGEMAEWLAEAELVKFRFSEEKRVVTEATVALNGTY